MNTMHQKIGQYGAILVQLIFLVLISWIIPNYPGWNRFVSRSNSRFEISSRSSNTFSAFIESQPLPADLSQVDLEWWIADGHTYTYEFFHTVTPETYSIVLSIPNTGIVPNTTTAFTNGFACKDNGRGTAYITFRLTNETNFSKNFSFYIAKVCSLSGDTDCFPCNYCNATCDCRIAANGSLCTQIPPSSPVIPTANTIKVMTYNLAGIGVVESTEDMQERHQMILEKILPSNYDILCFQEVWKDPVRQDLITALYPSFPFISSKSFGDGPSKDSGLFFASKYPILEQHFEEFTASHAGTADALADKGIFSALVRIREDALLYVFNTHCQASEGGDITSTQRLQFPQIADYIYSRLTSASEAHPLSSISVILTGDLNVDSVRERNRSISYDELLEILGQPKDIWQTLNPGKTGYTSGDNCDDPTARCSRLDYILAFDSLRDYTLKPLRLVSSNILDYKVSGGQTTAFGDMLSDHNPVEFEFELIQESETTSTSGVMIESSSGSEVNSTAVAIAVPTVVGALILFAIASLVYKRMRKGKRPYTFDG